jgi:hypothetical protein
MRHSTLAIKNPIVIIILTLLKLSLVEFASAEDLKHGMAGLLAPFKAIQPYIAAEERFINAANNDALLKIIRDLRSNFHRLERVSEKYRNLPGFIENINSVNDLLDDADRRFSEGKRAYAWWRLRKLPSDCFSCHATYKVDSTYSDVEVIAPDLDPLNRARFLLATRRFAAAQEAFKAVLQDPAYRAYFNEALRSILLIATRITSDPADGESLIRSIVKSSNLPGEDAREALEWADELHAWSLERPKNRRDNNLQLAEALITQGATASPERLRNDVALLRGTAILHKALESNEMPPQKRPKALYLLGFAYSNLGSFFSEDWATTYLERCIIEFPGTDLSKKAFRLYREQVTDDYTGSGGTTIPAEIQLHLDELRKRAFNTALFGA